jgi:hypothetical protein
MYAAPSVDLSIHGGGYGPLAVAPVTPGTSCVESEDNASAFGLAAVARAHAANQIKPTRTPVIVPASGQMFRSVRRMRFLARLPVAHRR